MNLLFQDANLFFQDMNLLFQVMILLFQVDEPEKNKTEIKSFWPYCSSVLFPINRLALQSVKVLK